MKKLNKICLILLCVAAVNGCKKKEEPPIEPFVKEPQSTVGKTLDTAKEKASELKESAGDAIDKAADSVGKFKDTAIHSLSGLKEKAGSMIEKVKPSGE